MERKRNGGHVTDPQLKSHVSFNMDGATVLLTSITKRDEVHCGIFYKTKERVQQKEDAMVTHSLLLTKNEYTQNLSSLNRLILSTE